MYMCVGIYARETGISALVAQSINQLNEDIRYMVSWKRNGCLASGIKKTNKDVHQNNNSKKEKKKRYSKQLNAKIYSGRD